jgi:hypothetical protein
MSHLSNGWARLAGMALALSLACASTAWAQDTPVPPNTLPCDAFAKKRDGIWILKRPITFDVGNAKDVTMDGGEITPKSASVGGIDLYVLLEAKCAKSST